MAIRYYPNRIYRARVPKVDRDMAARKISSVSGFKDITLSALDVTITSDTDWKLHSLSLGFSTATARNYSILVRHGRKVVENLNDYMWFGHSTGGVKTITLSPGFYSGTTLAAELESQLDSEFAPITWTVAYDFTTGLFTITPSAGTVRYLNVNTSATLPTRDSIGGHLLGFEANVASGASITNDTPVYGLDSQEELYSVTGDTNLSYLYNTPLELSIDDGVTISTGTAAVEVNYTVRYEKSLNGEPYAK
jgi:hypothetical protein